MIHFKFMIQIIQLINNQLTRCEFCINLACYQIETADHTRTGFNMKSIENNIEVLF